MRPASPFAQFIAQSKRFDYVCRGGLTKVETNTRKLVERLKSEGWIDVGGGSHDRFVHKDRPEMMITVPRHRELSPGVARSIAKAAGWL